MYFKLDKETKKVIAKAECGKTPPGEIVLRAAHCNFNCIPCFAAGYSHAEKIRSRRSKDIVEIKDVNGLISDFKNFIENRYTKDFVSKCNPPEFNWLRIVGGEPVLNVHYLKFLLEFIIGINEYTKSFGERVIVQTNGFFLSSQRYEDLEPLFNIVKDFKGKIVFEISIKGGNKKEFSIASKREEDDYFLVFNCIEHFRKLNQKFPNIDFVALAGFGPNIRFLQNSSIRSKITLYDPNTNKPFYHPINWDENFKKIHSSITAKYRQFNGKMPMAGLEDRKDWGLKAIERAKQENPEHMYDSYLNPENLELENRMEELKKYFFFTDPISYYLSLFM